MMPSKRPRSPPLVVTTAAQGGGRVLPQAKGNSGSVSHTAPPGAGAAAAAPFSSRPRMSDDEIHRLLVTAIYDAGVQIASPSKIAEEMHLIAIGRYPMLKTENIKSHLQRYRKTQATSKRSFLEDYDRFLERLQYIHSHNQRPGAFGMIDLQHVLGGKAAALMVHSAKEGAPQGSIAGPGGGREAGLKTKKKTLPKGDIHDYIFVHTKSPQFGINVTKLPVPQLTQAERNSPVGQSFLQIFHLLKNMERFLLQKRGIHLPPPTQTPPVPAPATVSLDTMRHSQQHPHPSFRGTSSSTANRSGGSMPPPLSRPKRRRRRNPDLEKLRRLLVGMSSRRQRRAELQRKNPQVTFSVPNDGHDDGMEDDSCSDSSSSSSSSFQGRNIPGRKGSLDSSTTLSSNTSSTTKIPVHRSFQSTSTSRLENEWIFEGVPKPQDLKSGIFLDMDSSSSSLSTDEMDDTIEDQPDIPQDIATFEATLQQRVVQRKRSTSDVSVIDGSLYVADDGSIRTTGKGRLSRQSSGSFVAAILEDQAMNDGSRTFAPPSPSHEEMMSYMESSLFQNDPEMTGVLAVDSNWNEFAGLSRSASPHAGHMGKQPVCRPNMAAPYSSHVILPTNPTPDPLHMPLAKPPLLAESQAMPPTASIPAQDGSFHSYHDQSDRSSAAVFEPPRTFLQRSPVGGWQEMPTPYNTPDGAQLHQHIHHEVFGRNVATGMPTTASAGMLLSDQQTLHVPAIQNIPQPPQPYLEQASLSQQPTPHQRRPSQLGRFYPVEAFPGEGNGVDEDDPLH